MLFSVSLPLSNLWTSCVNGYCDGSVVRRYCPYHYTVSYLGNKCVTEYKHMSKFGVSILDQGIFSDGIPIAVAGTAFISPTPRTILHSYTSLFLSTSPSFSLARKFQRDASAFPSMN